MSLTLQIGGNPVIFDEDSWTILKTVNERLRLQCTVLDYTGSLVLQFMEQVIFSDDTGVRFIGYLIDDKQDKSKTGAVDPMIQHQIDTIDARSLADNHTTSRQYLTPVNAGKIVLDLWADELQAEGINAYAATRYETQQADFAQGTLVGTAAELNVGDGDLELAPAGVDFTLTEALTADFASGTLTNMTATSNTLTPTTVNALKMQSTLSFAYGVEFAQSQQTASGTASGTATGTASGTVSGTATGDATGNITSYTPSGTISISSGSPGESATFNGTAGFSNSINVTSSVLSVNAPFSTSTSLPVSAPFSAPVAATVTQQYQPKTRSKVKIDATHYGVITVDVAVADNRVDAVIWTGSQTIGTNDTLNYGLWIGSTSPSQEGGVDLFFSDGTQLTEYLGTLDSNTDVGIWDQNLVSASPIQDLSDYAKDTWYTRAINLTPLVGKIVTSVSIFNAANVAGVFDIYIQNCFLSSHSGSPFFATTSTSPAVNPPTISSIGAYINAATLVTVVPVYQPAVTSRVSPAHSIDGVKLVSTSLITWTASVPMVGPGVIPGSPGGATVAGSTSIFAGYDGTTWLPCTSGQPLPGLPPGANCAGLSLYLLETFSGGQDPTAIPSLLQLNVSINSAVKATTTDVTAIYGTTAEWNTGTTEGTAPNSNGDLALGSTSYSWANLLNMTWAPGNSGASNPTQSVSSGAYVISTAATTAFDSAWSASRFNFISAAQNFTANADFTLTATSPVQNEIGFVYRQTYWGSPNNSFAYYVRIMQNPGGTAGGTSVTLGYGINNQPTSGVGGGPASGTFTVIAQVGETITSGTTYHLKLVVGQNRHTIYWNNGTNPIIDVLDNTYTAAGNIGIRTYLVSTNSATAKIANFTVTNTFAGLWTSPSISLSALGTCRATQICWSEVTASGNEQSTALVMASLNGGTTWQQCTNGALMPNAVIPGLPSGTSVSGKSLLIQIILSSTGFLISPIINGLYVRVCGAYPGASGTRSTAPLGNDMQITRTNASSWGTAFDGQAWAKVGTGTVATGSNVATIANTTGDVHEVLGSATWTDEDITVRFMLSAATISAGLELRYTNSTNWYRLAASTTALSIVKNTGGGAITLATSTVSLSTGTWYRLRFRAVGSGPVLLYGKVWPDLTLEPGIVLGVLSTTSPAWSVTASD